MRTLLLLCCWFSTILTLAAAPLKIVTWNIEWLPGGHPNATEAEKTKQMKTAQEVLKTLNPDILLCQEVFDWKAAEELCSVIPGLKVQVTSNYGVRPQNEVIASKLPVDSAWYAAWKPTLGPNDPPRGYAFAAVKLPSGDFLLAYDVHLKSNLGGVASNIKSREKGAEQLLAHVTAMQALYGQRAKCDVLIGGDFNSSLDDPDFKTDQSLKMIMGAGFQWCFTNIPPAKRVTIPAKGDFPPTTFDHFFYKGLKLNSVTVGDNAGASDHEPVVATFDL